MAGTPLDPDMEQALQARREMEDVWANVQLGMEPKRAPVKEEHPDEDRRSKFHRGQSKGQRQGKGSSWDGWENYTGHRKWEDDTHTAVPDAAIQAVIRAMTKLALRHEEKLSRLRIDTSWMVFLDNQQEGVMPLLQLVLPAGKLRNPHSVCYINSMAQALAWLCRLTDAPDLCWGRARPALKMVQTSGRPYLPSCLAWLPILRGWRDVSRQQDVCEFLRHTLQFAAPLALKGSWQARLTNPHVITDQGPLTSPIVLARTGAVDFWGSQATIHALGSCAGVVLLQLERYTVVGAATCKNRSFLDCRPGMLISLPLFRANEGTDRVLKQFCVAFVIYHVGRATTEGHYQAALSVPTTTADVSVRDSCLTAAGVHCAAETHAALVNVFHSACQAFSSFSVYVCLRSLMTSVLSLRCPATEMRAHMQESVLEAQC